MEYKNKLDLSLMLGTKMWVTLKTREKGVLRKRLRKAQVYTFLT